jgi:hypothetical protein
MNPESIRELLDRGPFAPFRIILSSGTDYVVNDPHAAALLKREVFVVFPDGEGWAHVPYLHIAAVQSVGNGRGRKQSRKK